MQLSSVLALRLSRSFTLSHSLPFCVWTLHELGSQLKLRVFFKCVSISISLSVACCRLATWENSFSFNFPHFPFPHYFRLCFGSEINPNMKRNLDVLVAWEGPQRKFNFIIIILCAWLAWPPPLMTPRRCPGFLLRLLLSLLLLLLRRLLD